MAVPNISLLNNYLLLESVNGIGNVIADDSLCMYGKIKILHSEPTGLVIEDVVYFNPALSEKVQQSGVVYYLIKESLILFKDLPN